MISFAVITVCKGFVQATVRLLFCPSLGLVEHGNITTDLQIVTVEPDGTLVGLAVFGIVDLSAFPLFAFLGETCQDVDANKFAAL
jgi:hypothetical protein